MRPLLTDVVVVGSGASGLLTAALVRQSGRHVVLVESRAVAGGSSALSDGVVWLPGGPGDSLADARTYLDTVVGAERPASSRAQREAFLSACATLPERLAGLDVHVHRLTVPDDYPAVAGARSDRCVEPAIVDAEPLGPWSHRLALTDTITVTQAEAAAMTRPTRSVSGLLAATRTIALRDLTSRLRGRQLVARGQALVVGLLDACVRLGVTLWMESPLLRLSVEDDRVCGVIVRRGDEDVAVTATAGVVLATGGFEHAPDLRATLPVGAVQDELTLAATGRDGTALRLGRELAAATDLLDHVWWTPTFRFADGSLHRSRAARSLPHSIVVDASGNRFFNEAEPDPVAGAHLVARQRGVADQPCYLVLDARHRQRYALAGWPPGWTPRTAVKAGDIVRASTLIELANALGVDPAGLVATVARFNGYTGKGADPDFGRGDSATDRYYGDSAAPHPSLGRVDKPPFYGLRLYPGVLGTAGGLVTDARARVVRVDGSLIAGLWAVGDAAASVFGTTAPAWGATLAAALASATQAADDCAL